jgi:hypothetical protein
MALKVEVALIGDPDQPRGMGEVDQSFFDVPYAQRRRVRLQVDEHESLSSVMECAAETMGLRAGGSVGGPFDARSNRIAFYKPEDEDGFARRGMPRVFANELILVDRNGLAIFGVYDHRAVRFSDLIRASQAGTLEGDPLRPYLMLDFGWGDAPPPDWATIQQGLEVVWQALQALGVVGGAVAAVSKGKEWLANRVGRARDALSSHPEWMHKGYRPYQFEALLASRAWTPAGLAPLLGCSEGEAEAVLWAMGYTFNPDAKRWERAGDEAAEMLANINIAIAWAEKQGKGWEPSFRRWLMRYLDTGECPPFESLQPSFEDDEELGYRWKPSLGERIDEILGRFRR